MKPRTIAASLLVTGCGLALTEAAWRNGPATSGTATAAIPQNGPGVSTLEASAAVLPWIAEIRRRAGAPTAVPLAEAGLARPELSLARAERAPAAAPRESAPEESVGDDAEVIGEPAEAESYFAARDRAAAHGARSR